MLGKGDPHLSPNSGVMNRSGLNPLDSNEPEACDGALANEIGRMEVGEGGGERVRCSS